MIFTTKSIEHSSVLSYLNSFVVFNILAHSFALKFFIGLQILMLAQADISLYLHLKMLNVKTVQPCTMKQLHELILKSAVQ